MNNKRTRWVRLWTLGFSALLPFLVYAEDISATDIMRKNFFASKLTSLEAHTTMTLITSDNETRIRKTVTSSKLQQNKMDSTIYIRFDAPNDVKGTSFLQIQHLDSEDDMWIFLPALHKTRRLTAASKKESFVGTDFSYGDILSVKPELFSHKLVDTKTSDGEECYVVDSTPTTADLVDELGYAKKRSWIRKNGFVEKRVEYFDNDGAMVRTQIIDDVRLVEPTMGRWLAYHREMINRKTGHRTVIVFDNVKVGVKIPNERFNVRNLGGV